MPVIGYLGCTSPGPEAPFLGAFHHGLSETGYVEGQNVVIEYRWAEGSYDRLPALAADLVGRQVDVIAADGLPGAGAAKKATTTIPIVFEVGSDPVEFGLVASLARPGGNLTGVGFLNVELMPKRLELLSELVPLADAFVLLVNPTNENAERVVRDGQDAARAKGVQLTILKAPQGCHRKRDRHRFRNPRPIARWRAHFQPRSVLRQPARAARGAGIPRCCSDDLPLA
jgi:putative ABC transport system substrate-binding protein